MGVLALRRNSVTGFGGGGTPGTGAFSVTAGPTLLFGFSTGPGTTKTRHKAIVTASGGTAPYTYLWTYVSGEHDIYPMDADKDNTYFALSEFGGFGTYEAVWRCDVEDDLGATASSANFTITLEISDYSTGVNQSEVLGVS